MNLISFKMINNRKAGIIKKAKERNKE